MTTLKAPPHSKPTSHPKVKQDEQWVYLFDQLDQVQKIVGTDMSQVLAFLGGKGGNLAEMTRIGLPVPPGFTISTRACNAYLAADQQFPEGLWDQVLHAVSELEKKIGKR